EGERKYRFDFWDRLRNLADLTAHLLRQQLPYSEQRLAVIVAYCATSVHFEYQLYLPQLLRQVEHATDGGATHGLLATAVVRLSKKAAKSRHVGSPLRAVLARLVERLSGDTKQTAGLASSPWRDQVLADIGTLAAEQAATSRRALEQAAGAAGIA